MVLAMVPVAIVGVLLLFQLITGKIDDLDQSLRTRAVAIARQLAPAAEYGVASGNIGVLQTLLEKAAIEPDIRGVAVFTDSGQRLAQVGLGVWAYPEQGGLPVDRIHQIEYEDRLVYYAPVTRTEVGVDDFNAVDERAPRRVPRPAAGWVGLDESRSATIKSQAMPFCAAWPSCWRVWASAFIWLAYRTPDHAADSALTHTVSALARDTWTSGWS